MELQDICSRGIGETFLGPARIDNMQTDRGSVAIDSSDVSFRRVQGLARVVEFLDRLCDSTNFSFQKIPWIVIRVLANIIHSQPFFCIVAITATRMYGTRNYYEIK